MLRLALSIGLMTSLSACATTRSTGSETGTVWTAEMLVGSMWSEICPGGDPEQTWVALYEDGTFAYLYPDMDWTYEGDDTWVVEGQNLVIAWNDNFATSRYTLNASGRLTGATSKSCKTITLEYTGPAPVLDWTELETPDGDGDEGGSELAPAGS